jgi:hypothetical protein
MLPRATLTSAERKVGDVASLSYGRVSDRQSKSRRNTISKDGPYGDAGQRAVGTHVSKSARRDGWLA